ncbi:DegT/DnrJ/EryC1/StrS family aminotransferase [Halogeometricum limi]|uniref:dTDP-4-amino-4,6-dideoxygalactose transaminase n=1 Tax=Halogeometricum limi TaxID=555875 RepID=A0A1I6HTR8_9EURY|nr:DegT/DnrJ/EryC1/StrS family aminotransferase [Halogeometricum limi]SFR57787.1 dTDP-4-amino-4,6-dideoxygalactose transaminase [Halogeometricum limi]
MTAEVPFTDVYVDDTIVDRVGEVMRSTRYVKGPELEAFEREFTEECGVEHAVGVSSGTAALLLSLEAAGVGGSEDEQVFVPGNTFFATASPVLALDATPVFVDVDPETYTMDPADLEEKVAAAGNPSAVMPVHIYGAMADMNAITDVADDYDLVVVEDACQAHFAERDGHVAGTAGDAGAFSFYPSKNMTVGGDGGMLVTDRDDVAESARRLRNHGRDGDGVHRALGLNYRLDEVKAVVGREQLRQVRDWNDARVSAAAHYDDCLADVDEVVTPAVPENATHVYHLYVVQVPPADRDALRGYLEDAGVQTGVHYETPAHRHPAVLERVGESSLPVTENLYDRILSLPMHPRLTPGDVSHVCDAVASYFEEGGRGA